ncbi:inositol phosphate phosphatase SopB, partial [Salmonella enterica]|uniref:inositol phosphate phosphatase SopB n=1 Tax=Salmonella enterica TaxID=28901 RepID=UPI0011F31509
AYNCSRRNWGGKPHLSLIPITAPTRRVGSSEAVFGVKKKPGGGAPHKVMKNLSPEVLNLSYQKRVGDENIWQSVKGISSLITS